MQLTRIAAAALLAATGGHVLAGTAVQTATGIEVRPDTGPAKLVRLELMADNIVHVVKLDDAGKQLTPSLMTVAKPCACKFTVTNDKQTATLKAQKISARVSLKDGQVRFFDAAGKPFLTQAAETITPIQVGGKPFLAIKEGFNYGTKDAFYGLGQHQNAQMNYNGEDVLLQQHNMIASVPFVVSDKNYGLLWDNNAITRFGDARPYAWLSRDLKLTDDQGKAGGLTARYYIDGKLALTRQEKDIAYQFLKDVTENWPKELPPMKALGGKDVKVVWDGAMASPKAGVHKMQLYASEYATLTVVGKQVMDVWRQGWNPW
jgi:alpha-D-xyloside xylohydrolase